MGDWNYNDYRQQPREERGGRLQPDAQFHDGRSQNEQYTDFQQFLQKYRPYPQTLNQDSRQQQNTFAPFTQRHNTDQPSGSSYTTDVLKSNLTPTAREFVPRNYAGDDVNGERFAQLAIDADTDRNRRETAYPESPSKNAYGGKKQYPARSNNWRDHRDHYSDDSPIASVVFETTSLRNDKSQAYGNLGSPPGNRDDSSDGRYGKNGSYQNRKYGGETSKNASYDYYNGKNQPSDQESTKGGNKYQQSTFYNNSYDRDKQSDQDNYNSYRNSKSTESGNQRNSRYPRSYNDNDNSDYRNRSNKSQRSEGEGSDPYRQNRSYRVGWDYKNYEAPKNSRSQSSNSDYQDDNSKPRQYTQKNYAKKPDFSNKDGRINFSNQMFRKESPVVFKDIDGAEVSQRERLTEQLNKGVLECLVCCERIKQIDSVWSCNNCFHVLHLDCIIKWARSSMTQGSWRCPACQNNSTAVPNKYLCFCGKLANPEWSRGGDSAHTCGNVCGRLPPSCLRHPCTLLCHAGPCPQCDAVVQKKCECGASSQSLRCSHNQPLLCDQVCKKSLNCKTHTCQDICHTGDCKPCASTVDQQCHCPKKAERTLPCDIGTVGVTSFTCGEVCDRKLDCGNHNCVQSCHPGECEKCQLLPEFVKKCPCGQTLLTPEQQRSSCLDPIPVCGKICSKKFTCGPTDLKHVCKNPCHLGECPPCPDKTIVPCRCGNINSPVMCINLEKERDNVRCKKKCSKKQSCGRHRCKTQCCVDSEHRCPLPCNRSLTCGLHRCEDTCHSGHCDQCWRTSFDELRCRCGAAVRYPPVPCGTRPPACSRPCSIPRSCGHEVLHDCHPEPSTCPPCTILTQRYCHGRHKMRKTIPCHQGEFSCGLPCGKELPCKKHKCIETCHTGSCPTVCTQQCETERLSCSHPCGAPCGHADPCPVRAPCKRPVNVSCLCKRRTAVKMCAEHMRDLQKLQASTGMLEGTMGQPVDIKDLIAKGNTTTTLDCDDECYVEERNRRMAIGLQIRNPDVSSKLMPRYSDFMKQYFAREENFCVKIHEKLTELVLLAQNSKQKTRMHSFQPMNHLKRQFVHEYCEHFGCESKAYDSEPYRNIVATAYREKSWLPALSLMEVVRRDKGQRRIPGPVVGSTTSSATTLQKSSSSSGGAWSTLVANSNSNGSTRLTSSATGESSSSLEPPRKPKIDYFDAPPEY